MKNFSIIIFWGALWGIAEATLGHLLHIFAAPVGWLFWFPLAYGFMNVVYRQTRKTAFVIYTALISATIKLIDLFMPIRIDFVINPAVSIILEGLAVFAVYKIISARRGGFKKAPAPLWQITAISVLWRILYAVYMLFLPSYLIQISPVRGAEPFAQFLLLESVANSLLIFFISRMAARIKQKSELRYLCPHPRLSLMILLAACFIQWNF